MKEVVTFPLADGHLIRVEVDDLQSQGITIASPADEIINRAGQTFEEALQAIKPAASAVTAILRDLGDSPDEASVEFGVKLSAKAGAVFVSVDAEANFVFKLMWKRKDKVIT